MDTLDELRAELRTLPAATLDELLTRAVMEAATLEEALEDAHALVDLLGAVRRTG